MAFHLLFSHATIYGSFRFFFVVFAQVGGGLLKKKLIQLILPAFTWTIIIMALEKLLGNSINYNFINSFWFLKSLFICYIFAFVSCTKPLVMIPVTLMLSQFITIYNLPIMYPCFLFGLLVKHNNNILTGINKYWVYVTAIFIIMMLLANWEIMNGISLKDTIVGKDWTNFGLYWFGRIYRILMGIIGSIALIGIFNTIYKSFKSDNYLTKIISKWGRYTLGIYIIQTIIIAMLMARYINCQEMNVMMFNFVVTPLLSIIVLVVSVYFIEILYKSKTLSLLLFGKS